VSTVAICAGGVRRVEPPSHFRHSRICARERWDDWHETGASAGGSVAPCRDAGEAGAIVNADAALAREMDAPFDWGEALSRQFASRVTRVRIHCQARAWRPRPNVRLGRRIAVFCSTV